MGEPLIPNHILYPLAVVSGMQLVYYGVVAMKKGRDMEQRNGQ